MALGATEAVSATAGALDPYKGYAIRLFIRDANLRQQTQTILEKHLGFKSVSTITIGQNQTENIERICKVILTEDVHVLLSPPAAGKDSRADTRLELLSEFLLNIQARIKQAGKDKERIDKSMTKLIPILEEAENYQMRMKYIAKMAEFRITSAFILSYPASTQVQEQIKERLPILTEYLTDHFTGKEKRLEEIKANVEEAALTDKKDQAEKFMKQGEDYKKTGNWEEAVQCFNKAIELMPSNAEAYVGSGRIYTKLKKYPRAIQRFVEAEEVSNQLPAPNQEIAAVRITQAKEMVAQGKDPESPEVKKLLDEASVHFKTSLRKASELKPLHQDDTVDRAAEATSKIAGEMFKMELSESLGARNPFVKEISAMARDSLQKAVKGDSDSMPASQMICLALADVDKGDFDDAEKLLMRAAEDKKYFLEAYRELNYMGTQMRTRLGAEKAIALYKKLLKADPPNKAAIHYNIAVASYAEGDKLEAAGSIVQAVYTDPSLPHDEVFNRNPDIVNLMAYLVDLFAKASNGNVKPAPKTTAVEITYHPPSDPKYAGYCAKFEEIIRQDREKGFKVLYDLSKKLPMFFKSANAYSSTPLMELMTDAHERFKDKAALKEFIEFLSDALEGERTFLLAPDAEFEKVHERCERLPEGDFNAAAKELFGIYSGARVSFAYPPVLENTQLTDLIEKINEKLRQAANPRLKNFLAFLDVVRRRAEHLRSLKSAATNPALPKLEALASDDRGAALDFATQLFESEPGFFELPEVYGSAAICDFAQRTVKNPPPGNDPKITATTALLSKFVSAREKYLLFQKYSDEALSVLMATADQRQMANCLAKAIYSMPECVEKSFFYEHGDVVSATKEIHMKLRGLGAKKN